MNISFVRLFALFLALTAVPVLTTPTFAAAKGQHKAHHHKHHHRRHK